MLIAPDEYRTFGMDAFFPSAKIYNPLGQQYEAVDDASCCSRTRSRRPARCCTTASPRPAARPR
ncbi:hypothetical protein ACFSNO_20820 [Streptomyces cirratus]